MQQASQGLFVGVGIVVLLWTMISLMSNIEDTFNTVWGVTHARSFGRKVIDYTAIMFLLPILMICSSGISVMASYALVDNPRLHFITPALKVALDVAPFVLTWMSFTGMYLAFPNTKVKFKNAFLSGYSRARRSKYSSICFFRDRYMCRSTMPSTARSHSCRCC